MTNEITPAVATALVPANWRPRFVSRFYEQNYVLPYFLNATDDFSRNGGKGDRAHITLENAALTVNSVGSDGSLTVQQPSLTDVSLIVDQNKEVTVEFTGITREQAFDKWENQFPISAGDAVREAMEAALLARQSDSTLTAQGSSTDPANLGEEDYLGAIQQLVSAKIPILKSPGDCVFTLADSQFAPCRKLNLLDYNRTGEAGMAGAAKMAIPTLWEIPVVFSTQVATSSSVRKSILAHKSALAWAAQKNVEPRMTDRLAAAKDSWLFTVGALYGTITVAGGRMVVLNSK